MYFQSLTINTHSVFNLKSTHLLLENKNATATKADTKQKKPAYCVCHEFVDLSLLARTILPAGPPELTDYVASWCSVKIDYLKLRKDGVLCVWLYYHVSTNVYFVPNIPQICLLLTQCKILE